ncbi:hypothetical protein JMJ35_001525 [Cladonia borealis]|uniref:Uncharacterized protein n=1 Tax=Cladonia borealis TaxID=184061 RepID=A0AA39R7F6_9LECA|nr:hypothetical protein JMJ35_001525 [Cladonia borealis]
MFCTTLRKRPDLSSVLPLLTSSTSPKLRESSLQTHDLALPNLHSPDHHQFLILLLSPSSLNPPQPQLLERITRFSSLAASPTPIIAFLLTTSIATPSDSTPQNSMHAYMTLQTLYHPPNQYSTSPTHPTNNPPASTPSPSLPPSSPSPTPPSSSPPSSPTPPSPSPTTPPANITHHLPPPTHHLHSARPPPLNAHD